METAIIEISARLHDIPRRHKGPPLLFPSGLPGERRLGRSIEIPNLSLAIVAIVISTSTHKLVRRHRRARAFAKEKCFDAIGFSELFDSVQIIFSRYYD